MLRYVARFTPEAWIRDEAVACDPEGEQEWDCTEFLLSVRDDGTVKGREYFERIASLVETDGEALDNDDVLKDDPAAPEWVREWRGPFTIKVRRA